MRLGIVGHGGQRLGNDRESRTVLSLHEMIWKPAMARRFGSCRADRLRTVSVTSELRSEVASTRVCNDAFGFRPVISAPLCSESVNFLSTDLCVGLN